MRTRPHALTALATALLALAAAMALNYAFWWRDGRPQDIPDARTPRIKSASFSPYRAGQSPFGAPFTREQLEQDMAVAARHFSRIRTYSNTAQFAPCPSGPKTRAQGHPWWPGRGPTWNRTEGDRRAHPGGQRLPDTVDAWWWETRCCCAERYPGTALRLLPRVKGPSAPVTYADVWEFWLKYHQVAWEVDSITILVLRTGKTPHAHRPRWSTCSQAHAEISRAYPASPSSIGEIVCPARAACARAPCPAAWHRPASAPIMNTAENRGIDVNLFELFDEPWKFGQEGTVAATGASSTWTGTSSSPSPDR